MTTRPRRQRKETLPKDVKYLRTNQLRLPQLKIMLEFVGIPLHAQPTAKREREALLKDRILAEPEKAQVAYDTIVWGKMPEATGDNAQSIEELKKQFYATMGKLLSSEQTDKLHSEVEKMVAGLEDRLGIYGKKVLAQAAENFRPIKIIQGRKVKKVKGVLPSEFKRIVELGSQRVPIYMVGPAGCGKSYIGEKLSEALDLSFADQSCSEGVSESAFIGWLLPNAKGEFVHITTPFLEAYEKGGVFLFDEIDNSDPNLLTFLNKAIANDSFYLPQRFKKPLVEKHKDFVAIAAANTYGKGADAQYVGRNPLDAATLDRFRAGMVFMDYSVEVESALIDAKVLDWGRAVRRVIYINKLERIMSTRVMLNLSQMKLNSGWEQDEWEKSYFADWSEDELVLWRKQQQQEVA